MHTSLIKELEARYSLLNLSVYDLSVYAVFKCLASSSNLSITMRCRVSSLIYTKQAHLYADKYSKKYLKVREADALKIAAAYITSIRLELEAQLRKVSKEEELAKTKKEKREKEERLKALLNAKIRDSLSARNKRIIKLLAQLLSNNSRIFASVIGITRMQAIKNKVVAIDSANSILCDLSNLLVVRFCIFSNSALENIGILINKEVVEMQTNTATALANKLTAINKLFALVCGFRKVDKYMFKANNTISVIAYFIRIFKSITKDTNRKHRLYLERGSAVDKVIGKHIYKTYNRVYALTAKTLSL
ncbi:hypothetical protein HBI06_031280 [Parastagonospora nodorum]|nr:hypothetical protein HBI06_031280 [Parastagonospora nodorum]KAH4244800.1 hypothetical protein HBI05_075720 [Parastagonospora nodorum]